MAIKGSSDNSVHQLNETIRGLSDVNGSTISQTDVHKRFLTRIIEGQKSAELALKGVRELMNRQVEATIKIGNNKPASTFPDSEVSTLSKLMKDASVNTGAGIEAAVNDVTKVMSNVSENFKRFSEQVGSSEKKDFYVKARGALDGLISSNEKVYDLIKKIDSGRITETSGFLKELGMETKNIDSRITRVVDEAIKAVRGQSTSNDIPGDATDKLDEERVEDAFREQGDVNDAVLEILEILKEGAKEPKKPREKTGETTDRRRDQRDRDKQKLSNDEKLLRKSPIIGAAAAALKALTPVAALAQGAFLGWRAWEGAKKGMDIAEENKKRKSMGETDYEIINNQKNQINKEITTTALASNKFPKPAAAIAGGVENSLGFVHYNVGRILGVNGDVLTNPFVRAASYGALGAGSTAATVWGAGGLMGAIGTGLAHGGLATVGASNVAGTALFNAGTSMIAGGSKVTALAGSAAGGAAIVLVVYVATKAFVDGMERSMANIDRAQVLLSRNYQDVAKAFLAARDNYNKMSNTDKIIHALDMQKCALAVRLCRQCIDLLQHMLPMLRLTRSSGVFFGHRKWKPLWTFMTKAQELVINYINSTETLVDKEQVVKIYEDVSHGITAAAREVVGAGDEEIRGLEESVNSIQKRVDDRSRGTLQAASINFDGSQAWMGANAEELDLRSNRSKLSTARSRGDELEKAANTSRWMSDRFFGPKQFDMIFGPEKMDDDERNILVERAVEHAVASGSDEQGFRQYLEANKNKLDIAYMYRTPRDMFQNVYRAYNEEKSTPPPPSTSNTTHVNNIDVVSDTAARLGTISLPIVPWRK